MNSITKLFPALFGSALLLGTGLFAQPAEPGLIGTRYAGVDFTYDHFSSTSLDRGLGGRIVTNLPFSPTVDLTFAYDYSRLSGANVRRNDSGLSASLLTFNRTPSGKAYFVATIGHSWDRQKTPAATISDNTSAWAVGAGYEVPVGQLTAVNAGLSYADTFDSSARGSVVQYRVEANHRLSDSMIGVVAVAYQQIARAPDAVSYTAGLRWTF